MTDSAAGLSHEYIDQHDIRVLPMTVIIDGQAYRDGIDKTTEEVYEMLRESGEGAKTSQPTAGEFIQVYEALDNDERYEAIIAVHASSELTGTYQSSISASETVSKPVHVIDSKIGSYPMAKMIQSAVDGRNSDESLVDIVQNIKDMTEAAQLYLLPQNFSQLRKSGRVSASQSMLASLLNIHIKLMFEDGKVIVGEKVRTRKKMINAVMDRLEAHVRQDAVKTLSIVHAGNESIITDWKERIESRLSDIDLMVEPLVTVAGVHAGHGTIGFGFIKGH
ncbi:DegV family protein [Salinicoccus albus]|uniref:DegV family protein n=1 Tax=Salinicoccus albus TaxID=418756 RepID=UPI001FDF0117|nr:DegV family protein [Salinicoccus albus]